MSQLEQQPSSGDGGSRPVDEHSVYEQMQATPDFQHLKKTLRRFIFPATVGFLAWYLLYVLMSAYARDFMGTQLFGNINVAYVFGLLQFVSTFVIAFVYSRFADRRFDPTADRLRHQLEEGIR